MKLIFSVLKPRQPLLEMRRRGEKHYCDRLVVAQDGVSFTCVLKTWRTKYWNKQQCFMNELIRDTIRMWATNKCEKKMKIHQLQTKYTTNLNPKSFNSPTHSLIPTFVGIMCTYINDVYLFFSLQLYVRIHRCSSWIFNEDHIYCIG